MNAFITCAQYNMFPSSAGGECYVLPYRNKGRMEAQFQLGYQGILTLLYRSGIQSVISEIVYSEDKFSYVNGKIEHEIDIFKSQEQRGEPVGVYVILTLNGQEIEKDNKDSNIGSKEIQEKNTEEMIADATEGFWESKEGDQKPISTWQVAK